MLHPQRAERGRMHDVAELAIAEAPAGAHTVCSDEAFRMAFPAVEDGAAASESEDGTSSESEESSSSQARKLNCDFWWGAVNQMGCGWELRRWSRCSRVQSSHVDHGT